MDNCLIVEGGSVTGLRASGVTYMFPEPIAFAMLERKGRAFITAFETDPIEAMKMVDVKIEVDKSQIQNSTASFSYKGGYSNKGKGSPEGDGKDKAMREIADAAIVELANNKPSSSRTTINILGKPNGDSSFKIMLARNGELNGNILKEETKKEIKKAHENGSAFVVGDMPGVDTQFIEYLIEIGAKFEVYHTGNKSRIDVGSMIGNTVQETIEEPPFSKSIESNQIKSIKQVLSDYDISFDSLPNEAKTRLTNNPELLDDSNFINALKC